MWHPVIRPGSAVIDSELTAHHGASTVRHQMRGKRCARLILDLAEPPALTPIRTPAYDPGTVSLKGIVKRYVRGKQRVQVLHGIDLEIMEGEFLALMGPSGSARRPC